jgi:hypothetical protein
MVYVNVNTFIGRCKMFYQHEGINLKEILQHVKQRPQPDNYQVKEAQAP